MLSHNQHNQTDVKTAARFCRRCCRRFLEPDMNVYFSDYFNVTKQQLDAYGAFNISLINDLPIFTPDFLSRSV